MFLGYEVAKLSSEDLGLASKDLLPEGGAKRRPDRPTDRLKCAERRRRDRLG